MAHLPDVQAGLALLVAALTGLNPGDVVWEQRDRPAVNDIGRTIALLSLGPITTYGRDELLSAYDDLATVFTDTAKGIRNLPLRIKVLCFEQADDANAWVFLERARTRLRWQQSIDALNAIDCARQTTGAVLDLQVPQDDRIVSIAALDVMLTCELDEVNPVTYPSIESVIGTGTIGDTSTDYEFTP